MTSTNRSVIIAGNWKMYKTIEEGIAFVQELIPLVKNNPALIYLAVPFTAIKSLTEALSGETHIVIGAQNMNDASEGAFTGEVAGKMLVDAGAQFVILGHSERRRYFQETNDFIHRKVKRALSDGLKIILCIGETIEERENGKTQEVLKSQIEECLEGISSEQFDQIILAYEPVWAIGVQAATPQTAEEAQAFCRNIIKEKWDEKIANQIVIQYGGSVKPENAKDFLEQPNIDGLLVGGASLSAQNFAKIVNCYHSTYVIEDSK